MWFLNLDKCDFLIQKDVCQKLFVDNFALYILCVFKHEITCENGMLKICSIMNESNSFRQKNEKKKWPWIFMAYYTHIPKFLR